ncbi:MAG: T9SS type A sorting domain-containing protein [Vicingaceae bacterium]|nr:T9SS type A sorting domain-containing protein [Vicingaceae bacterium]
MFSVPECAHVCTPKEPVNFYQIQGSPNVLATAMIGNSAANWFMLIENASNVEFTVFNRWGLEVYNYKAYDPSGLKDIGYNDYAFEWNGHDNNGNALPQGLYNFNLEIKNCKFKIDETAQPLFILSCSCTPVINYPYKTKWLKNCCKENAIFDNITFPNGFREDVNDFIMAGVNNPTIVDYGTKVDFFAGQSIVLGNGFQSYGNFTAEITPCGSFNMKKLNRHNNLITSSQIDSIYADYNLGKDALYGLKNPTIFPNPTAASINITQLNNFVDGNIEIINLMGQVIFSQTIQNHQMSVNLSEYNKGIYLVKISSDKEQVIEKIILE